MEAKGAQTGKGSAFAYKRYVQIVSRATGARAHVQKQAHRSVPLQPLSKSLRTWFQLQSCDAQTSRGTISYKSRERLVSFALFLTLKCEIPGYSLWALGNSTSLYLGAKEMSITHLPAWKWVVSLLASKTGMEWTQEASTLKDSLWDNSLLSFMSQTSWHHQED